MIQSHTLHTGNSRHNRQHRMTVHDHLVSRQHIQSQPDLLQEPSCPLTFHLKDLFVEVFFASLSTSVNQRARGYDKRLHRDAGLTASDKARDESEPGWGASCGPPGYGVLEDLEHVLELARDSFESLRDVVEVSGDVVSMGRDFDGFHGVVEQVQDCQIIVNGSG